MGLHAAYQNNAGADWWEKPLSGAGDSPNVADEFTACGSCHGSIQRDRGGDGRGAGASGVAGFCGGSTTFERADRG